MRQTSPDHQGNSSYPLFWPKRLCSTKSCVWTSAHCAIVGSTSLHGMIFSELRSYAEDKLGPGSWNAVLKRAGLERSVYLPIQEYPDCDASALIAAVSTATRRNLSLVLEDFGECIAPTLMKLHGHLLLPEWKTIDVIAHTEGTSHSVVRMKDSAADTPHLTTKRVSPDEVLLVYTSPRKLSAPAIGISRGLATNLEK